VGPLADRNGGKRRHFIPPQPGGTYWFRSQAIDYAGNVEAASPAGNGDMNTSQAIFLPDHHFMAIIHR
jgi:hypothetical protein